MVAAIDKLLCLAPKPSLRLPEWSYLQLCQVLLLQQVFHSKQVWTDILWLEVPLNQRSLTATPQLHQLCTFSMLAITQIWTLWTHIFQFTENCALTGYYAASSGNFLLTFRDIILVPSPWVKKLKINLAVERVYIGNSVGSGEFSVVWYQTVGLVGVVGREGECSSLCSFQERHFMWEKILTCAMARHRRTSAWAKLEKGKGRKCNIWLLSR